MTTHIEDSSKRLTEERLLAFLCDYVRAKGTAMPRYLLSFGPRIERQYGFASKRSAAQFIELSIGQFGLDWRVGWLWRLRGLALDLKVVDVNGKNPGTLSSSTGVRRT